MMSDEKKIDLESISKQLSDLWAVVYGIDKTVNWHLAILLTIMEGLKAAGYLDPKSVALLDRLYKLTLKERG
jgi:hypothetical protein